MGERGLGGNLTKGGPRHVKLSNGGESRVMPKWWGGDQGVRGKKELLYGKRRKKLGGMVNRQGPTVFPGIHIPEGGGRDEKEKIILFGRMEKWD